MTMLPTSIYSTFLLLLLLPHLLASFGSSSRLNVELFA